MAWTAAKFVRAQSAARQLLVERVSARDLACDDERRVGMSDIPLRPEQIILARRDLHSVEFHRHGAVLGETTFRDQPAIRETELQRGLNRAAVNPGLPAGYDLGYQHLISLWG